MKRSSINRLMWVLLLLAVVTSSLPGRSPFAASVAYASDQTTTTSDGTAPALQLGANDGTFVATPTAIEATLPTGDVLTRTVTVSNTGASDVALSRGLISLDEALGRLNENYTNITSAIPNRYNFSEGESGSYINDGGGDMYDGGNFISTDLGDEIPYVNDTIASSQAFGVNGQYFTRKFPGLWVLGADLDNVAHFQTNGDVGADGSGRTDTSIIDTSINGVEYRAFVKRIYNAWDPSVNQIFVTELNEQTTHEASSNTNSDYHRVSGLEGSTRFYYLLYASASGGYVDDDDTRFILDSFLAEVGAPPSSLKVTPPSAAAWLTATPRATTLEAHGATAIDLQLDARNLPTGTYTASLDLALSDDDSVTLSVPVALSVDGTVARLSQTALNQTIATGDLVKHTFTFTNTGSVPVQLNTERTRLEDVRSALDDQYADITGVIPQRFAFREGETGAQIGNGGSDMFSNGNRINTNHQSRIPYANTSIQPSEGFGSDGRYFTRKYPGLWVLVADTDNVSYLETSGYVGPYNTNARVDGAVIDITVNGTAYRAFVRRTYNNTSPSVNHIFITERADGATHEFSSYAYSDYHRLTGLSNASRVYYLMYGGSNGAYIDDAATRTILETFLRKATSSHPLTVAPATSAAWLQASIGASSIAPGASIPIDVTYDARQLQSGAYTGAVNLSFTTMVTPTVQVPVRLDVAGSVLGAKPSPLVETVQQGQVITRSLALENRGHIAVPFEQTERPLEDILERLNGNADAISALIPDRYDFSDGVDGESISDGGDDMFDNGNILVTEFESYIPYSDDTVTPSTAFGPSGKYFTRKYPGMWVLAADLDQVGEFGTIGGTGADGDGQTDTSVIDIVVGGVPYRAFVRRVFGTGDPTINQIIIVERNRTATHLHSDDTDDVLNVVTGIADRKRVYAILFASGADHIADDDDKSNCFFIEGQLFCIPPWEEEPVASRVGTMSDTPEDEGGDEQPVDEGDDEQPIDEGDEEQPIDPMAGYVDDAAMRAILERFLLETSPQPKVTVAPANATWVQLTQRRNVVPLNGTLPLDVKLDASNLAPGVYTATLGVRLTTAMTPTLEVPLTMYVTDAGAILFDPRTLNTTVEANNAITSTITITNTGTTPYTYTADLVGDPMFVSVAPETATIGAGEGAELTVRMDAAGLFAGTYRADLVLSSGDQQQPALSIPITTVVTGTPHLDFDTTPLDMGSPFAYSENGGNDGDDDGDDGDDDDGDWDDDPVIIGRLNLNENDTAFTTTRPFTITNSGTAPLVIDEITTTDPALSVNGPPLEILPAEQAVLDVTYAPTEAGRLDALLTIVSNAPATDVMTRTVVGEAQGRADIELDPDRIELTLENTEVVTREFVITNVGTAELTYQLDPYYDLVSVEPTSGTVAPQSSQTVVVTIDGRQFSYSTNRYDYINITTNDPEQPDTSISVDMTVTVPPPAAPVLRRPGNSATSVQLESALEWNATQNAHSYELRLWADGTTKPVTPTVTNSYYTYHYPQDLRTNTLYHWTVTARNPWGATESAQWSFTTERLADLQVSNVTVPSRAFSGQSLELAWTVVNRGDGGTQSGWYDVVYLSQTPAFDADNATQLGYVSNASYLDQGESYRSQATFDLPRGISSTYYIFVFTNQWGYIREGNHDNNTRGSTGFNVSLTPPPDLRVSTVTAPANTFSGASLPVNFVVTNNGGGGTEAASWEDRVYLSTDATYDSGDTYLTSRRHNGVLAAGESYTTTLNVQVPHRISGPRFLFVVTDVYDQVYEHTSETNNTLARGPIQVTLSPPPDLEVSALTAPRAATSGSTVNVRWTVSNHGGGNTLETAWQDRLYLSTSATFTTTGATLLATVNRDGALNVDGSYSVARDVRIPNGLAGTYYFHVWTDVANDVFEHTADNNNTRASAALALTVPPTPDLRVTRVSTSASGSVAAGSAVQVSWTTTNAGTATASDVWQDRVYVSLNSTWTGGGTLLGTHARPAALRVGANYVQTRTFILPATTRSGDYYVHVVTDADDALYEHQAETNNTGRTPTRFTVTPRPPTSNGETNLALGEVVGPTAALSGQPITVTWSVLNTATTPTLAQSWTDAVYLSANATLEPATDLRLGTRVHNGTLDAATTYTETLSATLPNGIAGTYYLFVANDTDAAVLDPSRANNVRQAASPLAVTLAPSPDFVTEVDAATLAGTTGQPLTVGWTVRNAGDADADGQWYDAVYLSSEPTGDGYMTQLASRTAPATLAVGGAYTATATVTMPSWATGDYYLVFRADSRNQVYEHRSETNNVVVRPITITLPPPSDLVVSSVVAPATALPSRPVTVTWTIENRGVSPARGSMCDTLFVSADTTWDINDARLGELCHSIDIAPNASAQRTFVGKLPGVAPGTYSIIVRTDIRNQIRETDDRNNSGASATPLNVNVQELTLGQDVQDVMGTGDARYYRVTVTANQTLLVRLDSAATTAANELYVRYGATPSRSVYDLGFDTPLAPDQDVSVPLTRAGTYYILAYGASVSGAAPYRLQASTLNFTVREVTPARVGNIGTATLRVEGARYTRTTVFSLITPGGATIPARKSVVSNGSTAYVTFNLQRQPVGRYTIVARQPDNSQTQLVGGLQVVTGSGGRIETRITGPSSVRANQLYVMTVHYANVGDADATAPLLTLQSANGATPIGFTPDDLTANGMIQFMGSSLNGPAGILRAGTEYSVPVYFRTTSDAIDLELGAITSDDTMPMDWKAAETALRPANISDAVWNPAWAQIVSHTGPTWGRVVSTLAENMTVYGERTSTTTVFGNRVGLLAPLANGLFGPTATGGGGSACTAWSELLRQKFGNNPPNCPPPPPPPPPRPPVPYRPPIVRSVDPNDILGPRGYGDARWIDRSTPLGYTIRFENDAEEASAPAQTVTIEQFLDPNVDARRFRLGAFGWGEYIFEVPENRSFYQERIDVVDDLGMYVDVQAGIDVAAGRAFWIFQAIDPQTGSAPSDATMGFLPPDVNDGEGQGFVTYTITPGRDVATGDRVDAEASIVFDDNDPINTPPIFNTVDADAPTSTMQALQPRTEGNDVLLQWTATDAEGGSGLQSVDLYVSTDDQPFVLAQAAITETSTIFEGDGAHTYRFFTLARDNASNVEDAKVDAEATTFLFQPGQPARITLEAAPATIAANGSDTGVLTATVVDGNDAPVTEQIVTFETSLGSLDPITATTALDGIAATTLRSTVIGTATITATVGSYVTTTTVLVRTPNIEGLRATNDGPTPYGGTTAFAATITDGGPATYTWDFGDATTGTGATPTHRYATGGTYTVTVTATNGFHTTTATTTAVVRDQPIAGLTARVAAPVYAGRAATFTGAVTAGSNVTYSWNFGDSGTGTGASVQHAYTTPGTYTARVTATNSSGSATATVAVTVLPVADLQVAAITAPATATARQTIAVTWRVTNAGQASAGAHYDRVYLSTDATFDAADRQLAAATVNTPLAAGASYTQTVNATLPNLPGAYYLLLSTDTSNNVVEGNETNNLRTLPITLRPSMPDLVPASVTPPATVTEGQNMAVRWTVTNAGTETAPAHVDRLYLSTDATWSSDDALFGGTANAPQVAAGGTYTLTVTAALPSGMRGARYVIVRSDLNAQVAEGDETNNLRAAPFTIAAAQPNLVPTTSQAPATAASRATIDFRWTVTNRGAVNAAAHDDRVYLSTDDTWQSTDRQVGYTAIAEVLAPNATYTRTLAVALGNTTPGAYYLLVRTDTGGGIAESDETDNVLARPISIVAASIDLAPTAFTAPATATGRQPVTVNWTIANTGNLDAGAHYDQVYLSNDAIWQSSDTILTTQQVTTTLRAGGQYARSVTFNMPQVANGTYYLLLRTDVTNLVGESNETNNTSSVQLRVAAGRADLVPTAFTAPASASGTQNVTLSWTVNNPGSESAPAHMDRVVMSTDTTLSSDDRTLINVSVSETLARGASYTRSVGVALPNPASGRYYLIVRTDVNGQVTEADEANNDRSVALDFTQIQPDLTVTAMSAPASGAQNQTITIDWTVANAGTQSAVAHHDRVYLSTDAQWSADDSSLATNQITTVTAPNGQYERTMTAVLPRIATGRYYILVRTDINGVVAESSETNNLPYAVFTLTSATAPTPTTVPVVNAVPQTVNATETPADDEAEAATE